MDQFYQDYLDRLIDYHEDCKRVLDGLPQDAIDWRPAPSMNSIGVLAAHVVGAERFWFGDVVMREPSGRQREQEFASSGLSADELSRGLDGSISYIQGSLSTLKFEDLTSWRINPVEGAQCTVGWAMLHVLRHTGLHLGHMEDARHMWEAGMYTE